MTIKQYDIVEYHHHLYRVMVLSHSHSIKLSSGKYVLLSEVELIQSTDVPELEIGDRVLVHPILTSDKRGYHAGYSNELEDYVNTVTIVTGIDRDNGVVELNNNLWFCPYHLEKIDTYDIL